MFSYAHADTELRDQLETDLKLLRRHGTISTWHDRKIVGGETWADAIDENFVRADIILLLVSADFLASDYCCTTEMQAALERHAEGKTRVVPVIARACDWADAPFSRLQGLPADFTPVTSWANRDEAFHFFHFSPSSTFSTSAMLPHATGDTGCRRRDGDDRERRDHAREGR